MRTIIVMMAVFIQFACIIPAQARSIWDGPKNRGIELLYSGFNLQNDGVVRVQLRCVKNWGGTTEGVANVIAFYLDSSHQVEMKKVSLKCQVNGGLDGARKYKRSKAKTVTLPVRLAKAKVRAYMDFKTESNINAALKHLQKMINKTVERMTRDVVKKPVSVVGGLEKAVAPAGGRPLKF